MNVFGAIALGGAIAILSPVVTAGLVIRLLKEFGASPRTQVRGQGDVPTNGHVEVQTKAPRY